MTQKRVIHRSSVTGRIVSQAYAKTHPSSTEREVVKVRTPTPSRTKPSK